MNKDLLMRGHSITRHVYTLSAALLLLISLISIIISRQYHEYIIEKNISYEFHLAAIGHTLEIRDSIDRAIINELTLGNKPDKRLQHEFENSVNNMFSLLDRNSQYLKSLLEKYPNPEFTSLYAKLDSQLNRAKDQFEESGFHILPGGISGNHAVNDISITAHQIENLHRQALFSLRDSNKGFLASLSNYTIGVVALLILSIGIITLRVTRQIREILEASHKTMNNLLKADARIRLLLDSTGEALYGTDNHGTCIFANPSCAKLLGYDSPDELIGKNMHQLMHHSHVNGTVYDEHSCPILHTALHGDPTHRDDEVFWRRDGSHFQVEYWSYPVFESDQLTGSVVSFIDISERYETESSLRFSYDMAQAITRALSAYVINPGDIHGLFRNTLDNLLALTDSEYGFIGEIKLDTQGQRYLKTYAITNIAWNDETRALYDKYGKTGFEFTNLNNLFGITILDDEVVISNEPASDPRRGGLPEGHPALNAYLGIPLIAAGKNIGMVGISNRPGGYNKAIVDSIEPLLQTFINLILASRDTAKRQAIEEQLRKNEANLSTAQSIAGVGSWDWDIVRGDLAWSDEIYRIFGLQPQEFAATYAAFLEYIHPDDVKHVTDAVAAAIGEARKPYDIHHRVIRPSGEIRIVHERGIVFTDANNSPVRMLGAVHDITEQESTRLALLENEQRLAAIIANAEVGIAQVGLDGHFISVNPKLCDITGYAEQELISLTFQDITHPDDLDKDVELLQRTLRGEINNYSMEKRYRCKDRSIIWINLSVSLLRDASNNPQYFISIIEDINTRKQATTELTRYKNTLDLTEDCIFMFDPITLRFNYFNRGAMEQIGYTAQELSRMTPYDIKPYFTAEKFREFTDGLIHGDIHATTFETIHQHKDGHEIPVEILLQYIASDNEPGRFVAIVRDVTERRQQQQKLEELVRVRTEKLQQAQEELVKSEKFATLGQLTGTVSHELRNPLGAIRPSLYIIERKIADSTDQKLHDAVDRIKRNVVRCSNIIDELLDYTRITDMVTRKVEIDDWLKRVVEDQNIPATIALDIETGLPGIHLEIDPDRMRRCLINIIDNGTQAMLLPNERTLYIEGAALRVRSFRDNEHYCISVSDTGSGMPKEVLDKIFEPLFSTKGFGVGLGMPTVKQIIQQHHGDIVIDTVPGKGTTVILRLPASTATSNKE